MSTHPLLTRLAAARVVPVVHTSTAARAEKAVRWLSDAGLHCFEIASTMPDALALIRVLASRYGFERPASLGQASFSLHWFQEDAVFRLVRLLNGRARGALLATDPVLAAGATA